MKHPLLYAICLAFCLALQAAPEPPLVCEGRSPESMEEGQGSYTYALIDGELVCIKEVNCTSLWYWEICYYYEPSGAFMGAALLSRELSIDGFKEEWVEKRSTLRPGEIVHSVSAYQGKKIDDLAQEALKQVQNALKH